MCFFTFQASKHIFLAWRGTILKESAKEPKFSLKMQFLPHKNVILDFWVKNALKDAPKYISELGNGKNIPKMI